MAQRLQEPAVTLRAASPVSGPRHFSAERLDQWELVELAAQGSMGNIYRARPVGAAQNAAACYAVKRLKPELEGDPRAISHWRREARVGRVISCPHLVPVLAAQTDRPPYYLVMPWLDGKTLAAQIASASGPGRYAAMSTLTALWIARQVAEALVALDRAGWTHADVKPANIMVSSAGHATLLDLGLARRPADEDHRADACLIGTPWYMAPETLLSTLRPDIRSDIYSLGAVLYEMLAGCRPVIADDAAALITAHRQSEPADLRALASHLPTAAAQLVHAMLAKEPLRRPQTPREVVRALTELEVRQFAELTNAEVVNDG